MWERKMKKTVVRIVFYIVTLSLVSMPSFAIGLFDSKTGTLVIPEVDQDGEKFYDNVKLKLDFTTGTFQFNGADPKPKNISATPLETIEDHDIKMDFMGCTRSARNEVTCHIMLTSLGGIHRDINVYSSHINDTSTSFLYDDLGTTYSAEGVSVSGVRSDRKVQILLVADTPTLAEFKFKNISPSASSLSLFSPIIGVGKNSYGVPKVKGDFRDIKF